MVTNRLFALVPHLKPSLIQFMVEENWQFFPCTIGESSAFIYLNVNAADSISSAPKHLAMLRLVYKSTYPNGLPTNEDYEPVKEIEDRLEEYAKNAGDWYVGRVTVDGHRTFYVYTSRNEADWQKYASALTNKSGYKIQLSYSDDPEHNGYLNELYPTDDDWQVIKDLAVLDSLQKNGDDGLTPRKVDHWVYFQDKARSVDFVIWAEHDRFTEEAYSEYTHDGRYCVRLSHIGTMKIADISSHTIALRRKAEEFDGDYDGWETQVIKGA